MEGSSCSLVTLENCLKMGVKGNCLICNDGYFIDSGTLSCVAVSTTITNCQVYSTIDSCLHCVPKYYMLDGECYAVQNEISGCYFYSSNNECL